MFNLQFNKLKSGLKSDSQVTLNVSSNAAGKSNDETNFPHKLSSTNSQVSKVCKVFVNGSSANINFSKSELSNMVQLRIILMISDFITSMFLPNKVSETNNTVLEKIINKTKCCGYNHGNLAFQILASKLKRANSKLTLTNNKIQAKIQHLKEVCQTD